MRLKLHKFQQPPRPRIDRDSGVIRGVSVITGGVTAIGHDLDIDNETLKQIKLEADRLKKVPVKTDHGTGVLAVCGHLTNFRIKDNKLLADWNLLKKHPGYEQIMETAEAQPETVGLSVSFQGPDSPTVINGRAKARCVKLLSVDYVIHPAANDGLFQATHGKVVCFSHLDFMSPANAQAVLGGVLAAAGLYKAGSRKVKRIARSPLAKAAAVGAAGTAGSLATAAIFRKLRKGKSQDEEDEQEPHRRKPSSQFSISLSAISAPEPSHLSAIRETIIELDQRRIPGPVGRQPRPGQQAPVTSGPSTQARDNDGRFIPGNASSPEKMREAYGPRPQASGSRFQSALQHLRQSRQPSA